MTRSSDSRVYTIVHRTCHSVLNSEPLNSDPHLLTAHLNPITLTPLRFPVCRARMALPSYKSSRRAYLDILGALRKDLEALAHSPLLVALMKSG